MMRKFLICSLFQLAILSVSGQQDYKVLYDNLKNMKDYEAFQTLFDYQAATTTKDYANVNGYYQLGLISQKMMRQYDPFLKAGNVAQCIANAKTYLSITLHYFNEKEAKKNGAYYQAVTPPLNYENIRKDIETRTADVKEYEKYFEANMLSLTTGITKYNSCLETFGKINEQNSRLNDLYFLADNQLKQNLKDLKINFDSTLYYLDELKRSLEKYPMGDYKISYSLAPVPVYRLHGLTSSDFLAKGVVLWDFNSWIDNFNSMLNADVDFLYKNADETNKTNLKYLDRLADFDKEGIDPNYAINPLIINKIYKYDFNAVVAPLLQYQEAKIKFAYHVADNVVGKQLNSVNDFAKSNSYYFDLIAKKQTVDSALKLTVSKNTPEAVKKYSAFFDSNYNGFSGFGSYLDKEAADNNLILGKALNTYRENIAKSVSAQPTNEIQYKNEAFYANVVLPEKANAQGYFIHSKSVLPNNKVFVAGSHVDDRQGVTAFFALLNENNDIEWLKISDKKEGKTRGVLTGKPEKGFAVVISSEKGDELVNYLYLLNDRGETVKSVKLAPNSAPRKLIYDDIDETILIAFKGKSFNPYELSDDPMLLYMFKGDLTNVWNNSLKFKGSLTNVIKTNNRFYVYGAYSEIEESGKTLTAGNNRINAFVNTFEADGAVGSLKRFDADFSYQPLLVTKISNEYVDMICMYESDKNKAFYMIISSKNEVFYKY